MESNCVIKYPDSRYGGQPEPKKKRLFYAFVKRAFDIVVALVALLLLSPFMVLIAIAIKLEDKGPAIFRTMRVGKDCKPFRFYKFRSMSLSAPEDCAPRLLNSEAYITKVGRFLRKTSLDELPQLVCILRGDMSFVGPRPAGFSETDLIEARERTGANTVTPGLTGLAQIKGRDILAAQVEKKAEIDGDYVQKRSLWFDLKIFLFTFVKVFTLSDVVEGAEAIQETEEHTQTDEEK